MILVDLLFGRLHFPTLTLILVKLKFPGKSWIEKMLADRYSYTIRGEVHSVDNEYGPLEHICVNRSAI